MAQQLTDEENSTLGLWQLILFDYVLNIIVNSLMVLFYAWKSNFNDNQSQHGTMAYLQD